MKRPARDDGGQLMILMIFFAIIIAAVITAVVDVSTVFLAQRQLQSTADGAALAAAQQADTAAIYAGDLGAAVPLVPSDVVSAARGYAAVASRIPHDCRLSTYRLNLAGLDAAGETVTVSLSCRVPLPFVGIVASLWSKGVPIRETAAARAVVTPLG